jgi:hypothetical protein
MYCRADANSYINEGTVYSHLSNDFRQFSFGIYKESFDDELHLEISIKFCEIVRPKYAFFYRFPFVYSAMGYASGIGNGEFDTNETSRSYNPKHRDIQKRIGSWFNDNYQNKACDSGYLREIYPINFINDAHLNHEIFPKTTLKNWIESADHHGILTKVTDELYAWIIPDEDLESITKELAPTDILLCVNKDNPQRYDYGVRPEDQIIAP